MSEINLKTSIKTMNQLSINANNIQVIQ